MEFRDGIGVVIFIWMGCRCIFGLWVGWYVNVEGMIIEVDGYWVIYNFRYIIFFD